jgi:hypothetical protein
MISETIPLGKMELKELLIKNWMSHDGFWFYHCLQNLGIEQANTLNRAAIQSLAATEVPRIARALGLKSEIETFEEFKAIFPEIFSVVKGDFMEFDYTFTAHDSMKWEMRRCFAYEGMKRMGVIDRYQCGVIFRILCWLAVLKLKYSVDPPIENCLRVKRGNCSGEIFLYFVR